jgi:predicted nucleotidyltransferase component of viral defense system
VTAKTLTNVAHSVHQRLLNQAKSAQRPFSELFQNYVTERFLYRLGVSSHRNRFVLKGAVMLRAWGIPQARPTMDIDLLGRETLTQDEIRSAIKECLSLRVPDDGIEFDSARIAIQRIAENKDQPGWRLRFRGRLGNARFVLQIDCGFGDVIIPAPIEIEYPTLLDLPRPRIMAYTIESALAEKYESMVALDMANSRMKDFYDVWTMALGNKFDGERLCRAIKATFAQRNTSVPHEMPLAFSPTFYDNRTKQLQWRAFLRKGRFGNDSLELQEIAFKLAEFLMPPTLALATSHRFEAKWPAGGPWG